MFDVISPDGFSIHATETYTTKKEAMQAFSKWAVGFINQGYYSSNNGRIPLEELFSHCKIIKQ